MDALLRQANFKKNYIDYNPPLEGKNQAEIKSYMEKYKDKLAATINRSEVPVVKIRPGMGFSTHTQEFLRNHFAANAITEIETRLIITKFDAQQLKKHIFTAPYDQFVIINGLFNTTPDICTELLYMVEALKDRVRFIISIYDTNAE